MFILMTYGNLYILFQHKLGVAFFQCDIYFMCKSLLIFIFSPKFIAYFQLQPRKFKLKYI